MNFNDGFCEKLGRMSPTKCMILRNDIEKSRRAAKINCELTTVANTDEARCNKRLEAVLLYLSP
ncbi:hypothetical protein BSZ05_09770 [Vibrio mediterranei]|uniref:Uncharacterized protein n=1 Tax=Vibrio mediterranei TaxID=689 RepID=A0AAN1FG84_9VIBR|nr:hypothetical protein BSZ05_09770 [Vibrio mediterranei]